MKLGPLHINAFGHFTEYQVPLTDRGLQVIYGPNEAGKTTLLEFIRGWLFDFPVRSDYDFKSGLTMSGHGELLLSDGRSVELRRRKGNKNKVSIRIDGQDTTLDDTGFQRLIGNAHLNLFQSVFAFGLDQLAAGEASLKDDDLQSVLFGGGLGGTTSPTAILSQLDGQALELFSSNARSNTAIKATLGRLKELSGQIKATTLRSDDYHKCRQAVETADAQVAALQQQVEDLRRRHGRAGRLYLAWPKWWELQQKSRERSGLAAPVTLPPDARQKYVANAERLTEAEELLERLESEIERVDRELAAIQLHPQALVLRAGIQHCLELKQSTIDAQRDLPERLRQYAATEMQVDSELRELRPGWSHADLREFSVDIATRAAIDALAEEEQARTDAATELRARRQQLASNLRTAEEDLNDLGEPRDASALSALLAEEKEYAGDLKQRESRRSELEKIARQLATRVRKLAPPLPADAESPHLLAVPRLETVAQFDAGFAELREQLRAARQSAQADADLLPVLEDKLRAEASGHAVPTLEERDAARQRRDAGWRLIRRRLDGEAPSPADEQVWVGSAPGTLADVYEQTVQSADELSDRIYADADAVARREELLRQRRELLQRIEEKQSGLERLAAQEAGLQERWEALWQPCGISPLAPDAMRRWLADHEQVCDTVARQDELLAESGQIVKRIDSFESRLREACGQSTANAAALLAEAHASVDAAREYQSRTKDLRRTIKRLQPELTTCDQQQAAQQAQETTWKARWQALLAQLHLPADWTTELARTVVARLSATRVKLDSLPEMQARIDSMQTRVAEFTRAIQPLCEQLDPALLRDPPELAVEKLVELAEQAAAAQTQHEQAARQLAALTDQRKAAGERLQKFVAERDALFAAAGVSSEPEFVSVVTQAEQIAVLDAAIRQLTRELELIRQGDDDTEFKRMLGAENGDSLKGRLDDLASQLKACEQQKGDADGAAAVARSELARLDGSGAAASLIDDLSRQRAHLASEVDRYVPVVFARHLLSEAVKRFERDNQPEMIATVSGLIRQMTGGRYVEFDRTAGDNRQILVRRGDGTECTPKQLSTGTREQLFLAIRLAYVLHYCRQHEPLPIIMDDVLVNFDAARARQTLHALAEIAETVQVLYFTCHPHMLELAQEVVPGLTPIELASP